MLKKIVIITAMTLLAIILINPLGNTKVDVLLNGQREGEGLKQRISGEILIPEDVVAKMGISISQSGNRIKIGDIEATRNSHRHSGGFVATKKVNGHTVPVYAPVQVINNKVHVPLSLLRQISNMPIEVANNRVSIGSSPRAEQPSKPTEPAKPTPAEPAKPTEPANPTPTKPSTSEPIRFTASNPNFKRTGNGMEIYHYWEKNPMPNQVLPLLGEAPDSENRFETIHNWHMPYITRFSTDDFEADRRYLGQTLQMFITGDIVGYNPNGSINGFAPSLTSIYVDRLLDEYEGYVGVYMSRRYISYGSATSWEDLVKTNYIVPQVIMYYFPQSWHEIYDNYLYRKSTLQTQTLYLIEGREVVFMPTYMIISEKGGTLNRDELKRDGVLK